MGRARKGLFWTKLMAALVVQSPGWGQAIQAERPQVRGNLTVQQAVESGLRENLRIRGALEETRAARAETRAARAMAGPQASANAYGKIGDMQSVMPSSPGVMPA